MIIINITIYLSAQYFFTYNQFNFNFTYVINIHCSYLILNILNNYIWFSPAVRFGFPLSVIAPLTLRPLAYEDIEVTLPGPVHHPPKHPSPHPFIYFYTHGNTTSTANSPL